jgi:Uma2 family endonuclease
VKKGSLEASNPVAVFEVLSPTTRKIDRTIKLEEYRRHPTLQAIVHIDPDLMDVLVYTRDADGNWNAARLDHPADAINLPELAVVLALADLYQGVPLPEEADRGAQR